MLDHVPDKQGQRCAVCGQSATGALDCPGAKVYSWDDWPKELATEKQLSEAGLRAWGAVAGVVFYTNRYTYPRGHWLRLFRIDQAQPKPAPTAKMLAAREKAKATALRNRTCSRCGKAQEGKIKREDGLCDDCARQADTIQVARDWLALPDAVIVDVETTGLSADADVIQIGVVDVLGNVLLDTFVAPTRPVVEELYTWEDRYDGCPEQKLTAFDVNGITNTMLEGAPGFADVWAQSLKDLLVNRPVIAFGADFERSTFRNCAGKHGLARIEGIKWHCAMKWYARHFGLWHDYYEDWYWQSLESACQVEGVSIGDLPPHRSVGDCWRTLGLLQAVAAKAKPGER